MRTRAREAPVLTLHGRIFWALVGLSVIGLVALFFFLRHGGHFDLKGGVKSFTLPVSLAHVDAGLLAQGTLFVSQGNCLAARSPDGVDVFLALPSGSHADARGEAVVTGTARSTGEEQAFTVGQVIQGSGGLVTDASWRDRVKEYWPNAPRDCLDSLSGYLALSNTQQ